MAAAPAAKEGLSAETRARWTRWRNAAPVLYDTIASSNMQWPCLSCRFGGAGSADEEAGTAGTYTRRRVYLCEQVNEESNFPNTILVTTAAVPKPRTSDTVECANALQLRGKTRALRIDKAIVHPGEVNRIRELPTHPHIIATHTDKPEVFIWDTEAAANRAAARAAPSTPPVPPDTPLLTLKGHTEVAQFALAASPVAPHVASGGRDASVLVWDLTAQLASGPAAPTATGASTAVRPYASFHVHTDTVEDVVFHPTRTNVLASVGDDRTMCILDVREPRRAALKVENAHVEDVQCVDWSSTDDTKVATGGADSIVKVFDIRMTSLTATSACVAEFKKHTGGVLRVSWHPSDPRILASSGEDGLLYMWELGTFYDDELGITPSAEAPLPAAAGGGGADASAARAPPASRRRGDSDGVLFCHAGHPSNEVVDFQFDPLDPWTVLSCSNDSSANGGSTVQFWRISDLIARPESEVLAEIDAFSDAARSPVPLVASLPSAAADATADLPCAPAYMELA